MKKVDEKSIKKILSAIASREKLGDIATRFQLSELTIGNIARGKTHAEITKLAGEQSGVKYIQNNKDKFIIAKSTPRTKKGSVAPVAETDPTDPIAPVTPTVEDEAPVVAVAPAPAVVRTVRTRKVKTVAPVSVVTIEDRAKTIRDEATKMVDDIDKSVCMMEADINARLIEIEDIRKKQQSMEAQRNHWVSVVSTMQVGINAVLEA